MTAKEIPIRVHVGNIVADVGSIARSPDVQASLGMFFIALGEHLLNDGKPEGGDGDVPVEDSQQGDPADPAG